MSAATHFSTRLSKSSFVRGWQCHRLLWWYVNERDAEELKPESSELDRMQQGQEVGVEARRRFAGGVLIDLPYNDPARVAETRSAIDSGAPAVFEATFIQDGVYVAVDVLERTDGGFNLVEVKATNSVQDKHYPDAAVQAHVVRRAGIDVRKIELMHLNPDYRHPDQGDLFVREDLTGDLDAFLQRVPSEIEAQREILRGGLPDMAGGPHCTDPGECPFWDRCWPAGRGHVLELYRGEQKAWRLLAGGVERMEAIPLTEWLTAIQGRQRRAAQTGGLVLEPHLREELGALEGRIGHLDFETVSRAIPVWPGTKPWAQVPVQFSYHEEQPDGTYSHAEWLAEGPGDPRESLARALLEATTRADRVLMYDHFERDRIKELAFQLPHHAPDLQRLVAKLVDLEKIVERNVYYRDFEGSFSLKTVLPVLVPGLSYEDLEYQEGGSASVALWQLMNEGHTLAPVARDRRRAALLAYCERDTWAMVKLLEFLRAQVATFLSA